MDIDPLETVESLKEEVASDKRSARLNTLVAITVAVLATFMGICKVKDDNIVQAMQQAQADKLDHWNFYQARNIRQDLAAAAEVQLKLLCSSKAGVDPAACAEAIDKQDKVAADQAKKKDELRAQAEQDQKNYDNLNLRDDQFDLSDAALAIAISLLAVTALTQLVWLYALACVPIGFGLLMGMAGLAGWGIHPDALVKLLS